MAVNVLLAEGVWVSRMGSGVEECPPPPLPPRLSPRRWRWARRASPRPLRPRSRGAIARRTLPHEDARADSAHSLIAAELPPPVLPENVVRPNVTRRDARTRDAARPGSVDPRLGAASNLRAHSESEVGAPVVTGGPHAAAISESSERQRAAKSRRCSARGIESPRPRRQRKYCRNSSNAEQKRAADAKLPKPRIG